MECPSCSFENIEGVDSCERCQADLSNLLSPTPPSDIERDLLKRPLGELVTQHFLTVPPDQPLKEVLSGWAAAGQHCMIVTENEAIVGILTERDVLNKVASNLEQCADKPVREFMTADPETLDYNVPIAFGLNRMMVGGYRHIPIERDGRLAGLVSVRDIMAYLSERFCGVASEKSSTGPVGSQKS